MSTESFLAVSAATWGVVMGLSPILQIRRMLRTRSSADVSIGYFVVLNIGFVLWISYGVASHTVALVVPNIVSLITGTFTIVMAFRLRPAGGIVDTSDTAEADADGAAAWRTADADATADAH